MIKQDISYKNQIINEDKKQMQVKFVNYYPYGDMKIGQAFGMRALLEPKVSKSYIIECMEYFSK